MTGTVEPLYTLDETICSSKVSEVVSVSRDSCLREREKRPSVG